MISRDNFLKGGERGGVIDPEREFLESDTDLDEIDGAVFGEVTDDEEELLDLPTDE